MRTILIISLAFTEFFDTMQYIKFLDFSYIFIIIKPMSLQVSTDSTFADITKTGLVLVDFWAEWCGPCQMMLPRLEQLSDATAGKAVIAKHDVDSDPTTPSSMRIMSIPTMILFKDGQPVEKWVGAQEVSLLEAAIAKHA